MLVPQGHIASPISLRLIAFFVIYDKMNEFLK